MKRPQAKSVFIPLLLLLMLAGCGGNNELLMKHMEELRQEMNQLKAGSAQDAVLMEDLQNKLLLLEDQVDSNKVLLARTSVPEPVLPIVRLSPVRSEAQRQPDRLDMAAVPRVNFQALNEAGLLMNGSPSEAGSNPTLSNMGPPVDKAETQPVTKRKQFDSRPIELYKYSFELLKKKLHDDAVASFELFLEQYPNHDYSDNALYWMGEAYYDRQMYPQALSCFDKVVTLFPTGNKVPDALLKSGLCYANSGDPASARQVMDQLQKHFPGTRAATIAQQKLQAMQ